MNAKTTAMIIGLVLTLAAIVGWVLNIVTLVHMDTILTGMGILRAIGVIMAPLGAILGYL